MLSVPWQELRGELWSPPCAFAQTELVRAFRHLRRGRVYIPGSGVVGNVPLRPLRDIADLGPDPRDVADGFSWSPNSVTTYSAMKGHKAHLIKALKARPNMHLEPRSEPLAGRPLRPLHLLWPKSSRLLIAMRIRLNTKRMMAIRVSRKCLSDVWWPTLLRDAPNREDAEKALVVWMNSTLGLLMTLGFRDETQGAWIQFKKPTLYAMPTLDTRTPDESLLKRLAGIFDDLARQEFDFIPNLAIDPARQALDTQLAEALGLSTDIAPLRESLAREPILSQSMGTLSADDEDDDDGA
jgi:hypothetical protein